MSFIPPININEHREVLLRLLAYLSELQSPNQEQLTKALRKFPKKDGYFKKTDIYEAFRVLTHYPGIKPPSKALKQLLQVKPIRTLSGVTPVTVLTKPYPCPGECIFCPSDVRMPKSYLSLEPGAQRAASNHFDPYLQVINRLSAFKAMGHIYDKTELLVLGGTWSVYPLNYRIWFIKRLFEALNDFGDGKDQSAEILSKKVLNLPAVDSGSGQTTVNPKQFSSYNHAVSSLYSKDPLEQQATWDELEKEQQKNQQAIIRCVGLVLETRPDYVTVNEATNLRRLGATKIQVGIQTLQDQVLHKNKRGHTSKQAAQAMALLRSFGFKLHIHWMPNLYGSTPMLDKKDYLRLFTDKRYRPDEIKIYPCSLIEGTELMDRYQEASWRPYTHQELLDVVSFALVNTPRYCRITRVVRDIPSNDIVTGNKFTNFRQMAEAQVIKEHTVLREIRSREIRGQVINHDKLLLKKTTYLTSIGKETFLEYCTATDHIVGFLRLSLPSEPSPHEELQNSAIIREVHVYGQAISLGSAKKRLLNTGDWVKN
jgi:elongator complex protein 3